MKLRTKILGGYGIALALVLVILGWAVSHYIALGHASDAILRENYKSILAADQMLNALERQNSAILTMLMGQLDEGQASFHQDQAVFLQWLGRAKDNITLDAEIDILAAIEQQYQSYLNQQTALFRLLPDRGEDASQLYNDALQGLRQHLREAISELKTVNQAAMENSSQVASRSARHAVWSTVVIGAVTIALGLIFSLLLSTWLTSPLHRMMEAAKQIATGDYKARVKSKSSDELGILAAEFNTMADHLQDYHSLNIERIMAEKQKSEAILRSIDDGLVVIRPDLTVTDLNRAASRSLDVYLEPGESVHLLDVIRDDALIGHLKFAASEHRLPELNDEERILTIAADPENPRHYSVGITLIHGSDKQLSGIVLLLRDVTRLKELDRLKSEFVMAASHELRTPLTSIGMSVDLLLEKVMPVLEPREQSLLEAAHEEIERLKALLNDLLNLSKIEAGKIDMEFESISLEGPVQHVLDVFSTQAEQQHVDLSSDLKPDLPVVRADPNKITWVLTNLVSNALRFVESNRGQVTISAKPVGDYVHVAVRDNGCGIPLDQQSRIFDKFVQVSGAQPGGTGLGLAISKEIVRAHGGSIWVESEPGHGATFTFTMPLA